LLAKLIKKVTLLTITTNSFGAVLCADSDFALSIFNKKFAGLPDSAFTEVSQCTLAR
jgi:hypothetical protein